MDPKDKVAMLTGGARIGQVVAQSLALHGCNLALIYRGSRDAAEASAKAAINAGCGRSLSKPMPPTKTKLSAPSPQQVRQRRAPAAWEPPQLFADEVRTGFRPVRK